jgi:hypothetical protein
MPQQTDTGLKAVQEQVREGQRFQIKFADSNSWGKYKDYYRHKGFNKRVLPVNLMFSILRSMIPQVYFRNPRVTATARRPGLEAELNARIVQKIDNWLLNELCAKKQFKAMAQDCFFCGIGAGFSGYDSMYGFDKTKTDPTGRFTMTQFDKSGKAIEFNANINPGMPWFMRARPEDVIFPWGATDRDSLEWVALRLFRQVKDVKKDPKYSNTEGLSGTFTQKRSTPEGGVIVDINEFNQANDALQWVELWQVHSLRDGHVKVFTMDHSKLLRDDVDEMQIDGLPVDTICFNPDTDYIYGVPDARIIEPQLLELNDIRTQSMRHRRIDILKTLVKKGTVTPEAIQKLTDEDVQAFVEIDSDTDDLRKVIVSVPPAVGGILQDLIAQGEVVRGDVRETVGFSRTAAGEFQGKTHVSATETNKVFQSMNIRLDERRDQMADLLERVIRRWNQIIFTHWTADRVANVIGPDGAKYWLKFNGPQIKDEYDIAITAEEGPNMDGETKKRLGIEAAQTWAQLNAGAIKQGLPVPAEIQRLIFSQFDGTGLDIDRLLAQTQAMGQAMQNMGAQQRQGASPDTAITPGQAAQMRNTQ